MPATLEKPFADIGARVKVSAPDKWRPRDFVIDVRRDSEGEYFDIKTKADIKVTSLDVQKKDRHLLLLAKLPDNPKAKFLCGHDERHWFTCAIPEKSPVSTVFQAKQALKPKELVDLESREGLKSKLAHKRHRKLNSGKKIHRQGEFMFIPQPEFAPPKGFTTTILKNEPMRGGGSHMHYAQFLYRVGGQEVYVNGIHAPIGVSKAQFDRITHEHPETRRVGWRVMRRDANVYAKGKISHEEHSTVDLDDMWHKVVMNTEAQAKASRAVAFLD